VPSCFSWRLLCRSVSAFSFFFYFRPIKNTPIFLFVKKYFLNILFVILLILLIYLCDLIQNNITYLYNACVTDISCLLNKLCSILYNVVDLIANKIRAVNRYSIE